MTYPNIPQYFAIDGNVEDIRPFGDGHINDTCHVVLTNPSGKRQDIVLQKMNTKIFKNPKQLMDNVIRVTDHLRHKIVQRGGNPARETLEMIPCRDGAWYYQDVDGECWRCYYMIDGTMSYEKVENPTVFYHSGRAFGQFMADLSDFPAETLFEVIPDFHNTVKRFRDLQEAIEEDLAGRGGSVPEEIQFAQKRKHIAGYMTEKMQAGELPTRVTHNDTKINNILMDPDSGEGVCIMDLDTVMPGSCVYDFGDSIRFGASSALEDEKDLSKVYMDLDLFEAYTEGYLRAVGDQLTPEEISNLSMGAIVITFETGIRFLADYLQGDTYFKISRPEHNLDRCRTQFKLVQDMEEKYETMQAIVEKHRPR